MLAMLGIFVVVVVGAVFWSFLEYAIQYYKNKK